jgi:DNA-binding CsgD family transcriptional regulator
MQHSDVQGEGAQERLNHDASGGAGKTSVFGDRVDGALVGVSGAPALNCDVRLLRPTRRRSANGNGSSNGDDGEVTAVVILRDVTPARVVAGVRAATRSGGPLSPELLGQRRSVDGRVPSPRPGEPGLTDREYAVLQMLADGQSTREIAERLNYSERTVKNIVRDLLIKLNCKTRAHAVGFATRRGVI